MQKIHRKIISEEESDPCSIAALHMKQVEQLKAVELKQYMQTFSDGIDFRRPGCYYAIGCHQIITVQLVFHV